MTRIKTSRGQMLDMAALAAKHEKERAVSNVPMNARGDVIDNRGNVKVTREKISNKLNKDVVLGAEESVSIKEEETVQVAEVEEQTLESVEQPIEVNRELRERKDGTLYYEVEYSDGSMEEIDA